MTEPHRDVEDIPVEVPDEPDIPGEGELDPDDAHTEGDGDPKGDDRDSTARR